MVTRYSPCRLGTNNKVPKITTKTFGTEKEAIDYGRDTMKIDEHDIVVNNINYPSDSWR